MFILNFAVSKYFGNISKSRVDSSVLHYDTSFNSNYVLIASFVMNIFVFINICIAPWVIDIGLSKIVEILIGVFGILTNILLYWSLRVLGENYQPYALAVKPTHVEKSGPYRFLRHPIYVCNRIQFGIMALLIPSILSLVLFFVLNFLYMLTIRDEDLCNSIIITEGDK